MDGLSRDLRYACRWLLRSPAFALVAVVSLGLGVGVNTAMFTLVDTVLLRPLPVTSPSTLVDVFTSGGDGDAHATSSYPDYLDLKTDNTVFTDVIGYSPMFAAVSLGDHSRLVIGQVVTANHFEVLGIQPERGRLLRATDDDPGAPKVVVLSHRAWIREFGGAEDIVGRPVHLRGEPYEIVGVAPAAFTGVIPLLTPELWLPAAHVENVEPAGIIETMPGPGRTRLERRGSRWMFLKGRLKPGVTPAGAAANVKLIGARLAQSYPETNKDRVMSAVPTANVRMLVPEAGGPIAAGSTGVMVVVGLVLLIACANVAGLLVARASSREREMSVRVAIGATRARLIQQVLVEGAVIGLAGVAVALPVAWGMLRVLVSIELPIGDVPFDVGLNTRVLTFAASTALLAGLLASLTPALKASSLSMVQALRGPATAGASRMRRWGLREMLVTGQVALTLVLLVIAGLLLRSLGASRAAKVGFDTRGLAVLSFDTDMVRYTPERGRQFWDDAVARARRMPGVTHVAFAAPRVPFELNFSTTGFRADDRSYPADSRGDVLQYVSVSPGYFDTLGVPIVRGRDFAATDREGMPLVAIVNEAMARKYWPDGSAVGRTITMVSTNRRYEIVGVTADHKVRSVSEDATPYVHLAAAQRPATYNALLVRTSGDADVALAAVRRELLAMEPRLVFVNQGTMERTFAGTLLPARVGSMLAAGFGVLGTALASIGLYGVVAFAVSRRAREIGIRVALGAARGDVIKMILRQGALVVAAGALAGCVLAALESTVLASVLFGVSAADPIAWTAAIGVLLGATALAHFVPARRALRIDPAVTLKDS
jgi:predicted permease